MKGKGNKGKVLETPELTYNPPLCIYCGRTIYFKMEGTYKAFKTPGTEHSPEGSIVYCCSYMLSLEADEQGVKKIFVKDLWSTGYNKERGFGSCDTASKVFVQQSVDYLIRSFYNKPCTSCDRAVFVFDDNAVESLKPLKPYEDCKVCHRNYIERIIEELKKDGVQSCRG